MDGDIIAVCEDLIQLGNVLDRTGERKRTVNRQIRVIAPYLHIQANRRIGYLDADRTQADDAQLLARDFRAGIGCLALFGRRTDIRRAGKRLDPVGALHHLAGSQQQRAHNQFLYRVCICARGVEHHDALLGAAVERDIVHTCARTCDALEVLGELHVVQLGRTHENRVVILKILRAGVLGRVEIVQADLGNFIVKLYVVHRKHYSFLSCDDTAQGATAGVTGPPRPTALISLVAIRRSPPQTSS